MIEIVLSICLTVAFVGLLAYLYLHTKDEREYISKIQTDLTNLPIELQKFYATISEKDQARTQKAMGNSFKDFLKHIRELEKMVLPKPVTEKDVKSVMNRIGTIADESLEIENDIEQTEDKGVEITNDDWTGFINGDTKVAYEDEIPTVVEDTPVVVK